MKCDNASVAQWQSSGLLNRSVQVQVLPGALDLVEREESEDEMERLISLFREPDYDGSPPQLNEQRPPPAGLDEEPLYFRELLAYLRQRKENASADQEEMVGV